MLQCNGSDCHCGHHLRVAQRLADFRNWDLAPFLANASRPRHQSTPLPAATIGRAHENKERQEFGMADSEWASAES